MFATLRKHILAKISKECDSQISGTTVIPFCSKMDYCIKVIKGASMQLTPIASNMTEVETSEARILFSYRTPVAAYIFGEGYVKTEKYWSVTTSRHINKWGAKEVAQTYLDKLV